jgi:hypothetical protein
MSSKSLWADLGQLPIVRAPRTVLLEQAQYLTEATKGALIGKVADRAAYVVGAGFRYLLVVQVPELNNYSVEILWIDHGIELYPVRLGAGRPNKDVSCANEAELERAIESVLSSSEVKTILSHLLSQLAAQVGHTGTSLR